MIEKDALVLKFCSELLLFHKVSLHFQIQSIDQRDYGLSILFSRTPQLHHSLLVHGPITPEEHTQTIEYLTDPGMLEHALLDSDGRIVRSERSTDESSQSTSFASWKRFTIWRVRHEAQEMINAGEGSYFLESKGDREPLGTLFFLKEFCHV